jgi:hypothetical protein
VGYEPQLDREGERLIWLETAIVNRLGAMRGPGESYSDVILRLVEMETAERSVTPVSLPPRDGSEGRRLAAT